MISFDKLRQWAPPIARQSYDARDCALYALAHGLGADPTDTGQLGFVAAPLRNVFPTMPLALANEDRSLEHSGTGVDYGQVVLGAQTIVLHRPLPLAASVVSRGEVGSIVDKGPGRSASITLVRRLYDEREPGGPLATMSATYVAHRQGGFGGPGAEADDYAPLPAQAPDISLELKLLPQLALLYDLTGDYVPFHVDPAAARVIGFDRPILHGLCTVGLAARAVMEAFPELATTISGVAVRLGAIVYPGEQLRFDLWRRPAGFQLRATAIARDTVVVRNAAVDVSPR